MMLKRPSKKRIEKFSKLMLDIQSEYGENTFLIRTRPGLNNLKMQLEFPLERLSSEDVKIEGLLIRDIMRHLSGLWLKVLNHPNLLHDGYDFRKTL